MLSFELKDNSYAGGSVKNGGIWGDLWGPKSLLPQHINCQTALLGYDWVSTSDSHFSLGLFLCLKWTLVSHTNIIIKWAMTRHCMPAFLPYLLLKHI